jgi:putative ABC transport system permease protein
MATVLRRRSVVEAFGTVVRNPLRSSLAVVAVAVAVATTVTVQTALDSLARSAREASARAFGSDTFVIARVAGGSLSRRELAERLQRNPDVTRSDVRFLRSVAGDRVAYAATVQRAADVIAGSRRFENATINGTQATLADIRDVGVEVGRFFSADEETRAASVVVAGRAVLDALFPVSDPLGQQVRIAGRAFTIVGIQARQGAAGSVSLDRYVWMPITTFERAFGASPSLQVFAKGEDDVSSDDAESHARVSMRARRHLEPGVPDNFDIITPEASRSFVSTITERIGAAGPPISLMALLAAIVVVANTTLVSVTQRTREIGIRRAVGASPADVVAETLAESTIIGAIGGGAGLALAATALSIASRIGRVELPIGALTAVLSVVAAVASGIAAGWYPARRASALNIVDALRHE